MKRIPIIAPVLLLLIAAGCASTRTPAGRVDRRPNVLFIILDDAGYGDFGCHGNKDVQTPTLDRLWADSTRLTRYCAQPVCTPTRACLMTGRDYFRTGAINTLYRDMMRPDEVTLAEVFRAAGYRTGIFGKWHLGSNYPMRPIDQGFEEEVVIRGGGLGNWFERPGSSYFDPILQHNGRDKLYRGYCNDIWFNEAGRFIREHRKEPFFCYLATNLPHDPLIAPLNLWLPIHERGVNEENAIVYAMMKNIDDNLAKLLKQLDDEGLTRDTIIVFTSDNGPAMQLSEHQLRYNAGLRGEKKQVYEGGIRVPFFVRWPGHIAARRDIDRVASPIDVLPTLSEACGVPLPTNVKLDGKSLWPLLSGAVAPEQWPDRTLFFQWSRDDTPVRYRNAAVRTQRWKLVDGKELYDEQADLAEAHDVAAAHPQVVSDLRQRYEAWFDDACSAGFAYPRVQIGTRHENPVNLNPRNWELEGKNGRGPIGHWVVQVVNGGTYRVSVVLRDTQHAPGEVHLQIGETDLTRDVSAGTSFTPAPSWPPLMRVEFPPVFIAAQANNLKVWYTGPDGQHQGVAEVCLELTSMKGR
jgi:arylsulfatase A-like enzyme